MLVTIARFEIRYLLRNPLLWLTAAIAFAMVFFSMNVEAWEMGSEGGCTGTRRTPHSATRSCSPSSSCS